MKDVLIDQRENWQARHWKTIESCYNRSPFLDHYRGELRDLYRKKNNFLLDWNLQCTEWMCAKLAIKTVIRLSDAYQENYDPQKFTDCRNRVILPIPGQPPVVPERYPQVFEDRLGFIPNLSILDRLFCNGNKW